MVSWMTHIDKLDRGEVQAYATRHFTVQTMAAKYHNVYQKLLAPRHEKKYATRQNSLLAPLPPKLKKIDPAAYRRVASGEGSLG
jgi:hypothetical protein